MWQRMGEAADVLHACAVAAWHLQRVLAKKKDPLSHDVFQDLLVAKGSPLPLDSFWYGPASAAGACQSLCSACVSCAKHSWLAVDPSWDCLSTAAIWTYIEEACKCVQILCKGPAFIHLPQPQHVASSVGASWCHSAASQQHAAPVICCVSFQMHTWRACMCW